MLIQNSFYAFKSFKVRIVEDGQFGQLVGSKYVGVLLGMMERKVIIVD